MHHILIQEYGGALGLRDKGLLQAALARPRSGYYSTILEEAAALLESLANNHPFVDGNKRVAFFTTDAFLRANGWKIVRDNKKAYEDFMKLFAENRFVFRELKIWLTRHTIPLLPALPTNP